MKNRIMSIPLVLLLAMSLVAIGCPVQVVEQEPEPEPIVLTLVSFLPKGHITSAGAERFVELVNERAKGELIIDYLGGPEVIPTFDQLEALMAGVVDFVHSTGNYWVGVIPESDMGLLAQGEPWVDRETGFYDFLVEAYARVGVRYLGQFGGGHSGPFYLFTNIRVDRPQQLAGQMMRAVPVYIPFMEALGIKPITMPAGEIYLAMERGVVDGFGWPIFSGFVEMGFPEVTRYAIDHPFYRGCIAIKMNLDSYNQLPEHLRDLIHEVVIEVERWAVEYFAEHHQRQRREAKELGVEFIRFTEADTKWYLDLAYESIWEVQMARMEATPELRAKLEAMLKKP